MRSSRSINLRAGGASELETLFGAVKPIVPWFVTFFALPIVTIIFRVLWHDHPFLPTSILAVGTVALCWLVRKMTHNRSRFGRRFAIGFTAAPMTLMTITVGFGMPGVPNNPLFVLWVVGGLIACIAWNIRYRKRDDDDFEIDTPRALPAAKTDDPAAIEAAEAKARQAEANKRALQVVTGFKALTNPERGMLGDDLSGAKIKVLPASSSDYRTDAVVRLVPGVEPKPLLGARGVFASKFRVGPSDVRMNPNPKDNSRVLLRVVWKNPLEGDLTWAGPQHVGKSIAVAGVDHALYEDQVPGELYLPFRKTRAMTQQASHVLFEGMNGTGKSTTMLVCIADWCTRNDVVISGIDAGKGLQTLACVAPSFDWFAATKDQARALMMFIKIMIPVKATLLRKYGFSNWEPKAYEKYGIPFDVVPVEEGGLIFEALGKSFPEVMMTARSAGVCMIGSIQRAQHEWLDTTARAQFSQFLTFGMASDEDAFGLPDEMKDLGCSPQQWKNKAAGMHYHYRPDVDTDRLITPLKGRFAEEKALAEIVWAYRGQMAQRSDELMNAVLAVAGDELAASITNRPSGVQVMRDAGLELPGEVSYTVTDDRPAPQERETVTVRTAPRSEPAPTGGTVVTGHFGTAKTAQPTVPVDESLLGSDGADEPTNGEKVRHVTGADGVKRVVYADGEELDLEEVHASPDDLIDPDIPVPAEPEDGIVGFADDGRAASAISQPADQVLAFPDDPDDVVTNAEGAKQALMNLLATRGENFVFRAADLYDSLPQVGEHPHGRSKSWIRTQIGVLAEVGKYVERINDPGSKLDGMYRTTQEITKVRAGGRPQIPA